MSRSHRLMLAGRSLGRHALFIIAIAFAVFVLVRVVPGDVVDFLGVQGDLDAAGQAKLRQELGLDRSPAAQFVDWSLKSLSGDFGRSLRYREPVIEMMGRAATGTMVLASLSLAIGLVLGVSLAVAATIWPRRWLGWLVGSLNVWSIAMPTFCVGLGIILVFAIWLRWMPVIGNVAAAAIVIGIDIAGQLVKPLAEDLQETMATGHVRAARARGVGPIRLVLSHVLPHSLTVVIALSGLILAGVVGGTITVEVLFGLPGIGSLALDAVRGRDYPVVQGVVMVLAAAIIAVNALADLALRLVDPRHAVA
ncbi:ABC transporter permease [soil metagenome]